MVEETCTSSYARRTSTRGATRVDPYTAEEIDMSRHDPRQQAKVPSEVKDSGLSHEVKTRLVETWGRGLDETWYETRAREGRRRRVRTVRADVRHKRARTGKRVRDQSSRERTWHGCTRRADLRMGLDVGAYTWTGLDRWTRVSRASNGPKAPREEARGSVRERDAQMHEASRASRGMKNSLEFYHTNRVWQGLTPKPSQNREKIRLITKSSTPIAEKEAVARNRRGKRVDEIHDYSSTVQTLLPRSSAATVMNLREPRVSSIETSALERKGHFREGLAVEMEASIMNGRGAQCGVVSDITTVKNPISPARLVMDKSLHSYLSFSGSEKIPSNRSLPIQIQEPKK
ncbi:isoaspartyl peptidase/L-asparaginase [Striga asiatica]|uniref:Isoaspartyl peptidase/L-asparaginase n=1 Tax=Striga asiatica TaxID=4170 RepID=A0A5A7PGR9_STRAF|nr:isoaspartyl peptidase/L-asparaginase [Striga asiatica]